MGLLKELLEDTSLKFQEIKLGAIYHTTSDLEKIKQGTEVKVIERKPFGAQLQIKIATLQSPIIEQILIGDAQDEIDLK